MALKGQKAPSFTLPDANGKLFTLTPGHGKPIAIFFYPHSGSLGCTKEACEFRDAVAEKPMFNPDLVQVVGVSPDPVERQTKFVTKHNLNYPVLSDEKGEVRAAYKVGKGLMGLTEAARVTFVIDGQGIVRDELHTTLNASAHSKFVGKWFKTLVEESRSVPGKGGSTQAEAQKASA